MNYKKISLCLFLIFTVWLSKAQQKQKDKNIPTWKISFHLDFGEQINTIDTVKKDQEQTILMELAKSLSGSSNEQSPLVCYVNSNYIRAEQNGLGGGVTIADKRDTISFLLDTTEKTATRYPAAMPNLHTQLNGDSVTVISSDDFVMELEKDTMTIVGLVCKKAIFRNPGSPANVITIWYAPQLPRLYWQKYSYLKQVPGCALSIGTVTKGLNVGIKADHIEQLPVNESFFLPPVDYTITEGVF